jgi:2-polyprenyl-3-methyl-5-hydroxy-6-metoxy-1,4-benzoquinol methylase
MIRGLAGHTDESGIRKLFGPIGGVDHVELVRNIITGRSKGYALVKMASEADVRHAIGTLDGALLDGARIAAGPMRDTMPGEMTYREWFQDNAPEVLRTIGLAPGMTVLDFGCGPGIFTLAAADILGDRGKIYALDVRQEALDDVAEKAAKKGIATVGTILYDRSTRAVPLEDGSLDAVLLFDVVHDIDERNELLTELHRILRPGGMLSVYPMHLGTEAFLALINPTGLFAGRDRCPAPGFPCVSEITNFIRR